MIIINIFVDADGCPVVDIAIEMAKEYKKNITVVKNYAHNITSDYANIVTVDISRDSADYYIVNHISAGDIVITQDYGLAAMVLARGGVAISQNGHVITVENIDGMLNTRHINQKLRRQNIYTSKFKKRNNEANIDFEAGLRKLMEE